MNKIHVYMKTLESIVVKDKHFICYMHDMSDVSLCLFLFGLVKLLEMPLAGHVHVSC
jgi:hypothetical protein